MKIHRRIAMLTLLAVSATLLVQTSVAQTRNLDKVASEAELLEKSREAGLLTDWHLVGHFGHGAGNEIGHAFAPEKKAAKLALRGHRFEETRYELVFSEGTFALPLELASRKGVFYANSSTYLASGGEWNVYLESGAEAVVFVDGRRVLARGPKARGALRGRIHAESGYHSVMVKFTAHSAPFRVAILPLNSGSKRKNNTPYLQASPASEYMQASETASPGEALFAGNY